eukprot:NODE_304_length_1939_cov_300.968254_g254_i0.p1 GENE.NODE_304_length_1939_cov_300.968254_g254_i0~~NODE_304_length_1939_cov_300.968254_g254_i0.p1  ORF type:complete len:386 (+),score=186.73 NODE_304_length_1939_cov_300.968254_g254_i0:676-1833(+)
MFVFSRHAKEMLGLDLSGCTNWLKFVEFNYSRENGEAARTTVFIPNVWSKFTEMEPKSQVSQESKEVEEEIEEEVEDPEDSSKKTTIKKKVTTTKNVDKVEIKPHEMTLTALLDYDCTRAGPEEVSELILTADCFDEMLQRDFGMDLLEILRKKKQEVDQAEADKKRKREEEEAAEAAKKQKLEEEEALKKQKTEAEEKEEAAKKEEKKEEEKKEEEKEKPKMILQHHINQEMLVPFQYFDRTPQGAIVQGHLKRESLEAMLYQLGDFSKREVDDLLSAVGLARPIGFRQPPPVLYYIKMATTTTEVPAPEEKKEEEKKEEGEKMEEDGEEAGEEAGEAADDGKTTEESLNKMLLKDLRAMCVSRGLSDKGKKAELVERILKGED